MELLQIGIFLKIWKRFAKNTEINCLRHLLNIVQIMVSLFRMAYYSRINNFICIQGAMIAWNGCEKIINKSKLIVEVKDQTKDYFNSLIPVSECELGIDISSDIKSKKIKIS